jgi:YbgC/YbaW family acyl-CoA thioester hydrolase
VTGEERAPLATARRRIAMADVDSAQILYFASPFRWFEAQFTEFLADAGHPLSKLLAQGLGMPIIKSSCEYLIPLSLDDVVEQQLIAERIGRTSFSIRCDIGHLPDVAVRVSGTYVWSEREGDPRTGRYRPAPVPAWLKEALGL